MSSGDTGFASLKRSDVSSLTVVMLHLTLVLTPVYLASFMGPGIHLVLNWIVFGLGMNGLLNLMHECAHYHVFKKKWGSVFLGRWILGPLALADFDGYQKRHWLHHRKLGEPEDPKYVYRVDIRGRRFVKFCLGCLLLVEGFRKLLVQADSKTNPDLARITAWSWVVRTLCVQGFFLLSLFLTALGRRPNDRASAVLAATVAYVVVYLYGTASVTIFASSMRAIAEHQIGSDQAKAVNHAALRNFSSGPLLDFILGAYGFTDHATHHAEPGLAYYRLKVRTRELAQDDPAFAPIHNYQSTLLSLINS